MPNKREVNVFKVGGAVVEDHAQLTSLIEQFAKIEGHKVLVHGGGRSATKMATRLGIESHMVEGRRVTDEEMLSVVTMVYGGLVNKQIVARLQAAGVNAIGLTGADMNIIRAHRRPRKMVTFQDGHTEEVDYGWVGDVDHVDGAALHSILQNGGVPVVAPLTHDGEGHLLNTNADTMAQETACGLVACQQQMTEERIGEVTLTYCFEKPGVLRDPDDDNSVIPLITEQSYAELKSEGIVSGGMIPKLDNAFAALQRGVSRVVITAASDIEGKKGTTIKRS
ncbi:MAG: acetylglutamate kinase [Bacteroidales bacterium]|nr:acetylglutamate kinase [Candidatus Physcousia equi]